MKAIDLLIRPGGATKKELAEELGVTERHVYRILDKIQELYFPIYDEIVPFEKEKRWKIEDSFVKKLPNITIPDTQLTISEVIALYLLKAEDRVYADTEIESKISAAFRKLGMLLPEKTVEQLEKIKSLFIANTKFKKDYSGKEKIIDGLIDAMLQRKICVVTYHSFSDDRVKTFKVNPLRFFERNGGLYFLGQIPMSQIIITLAVERIQELTITQDSFTYPDNFNPQELLDTAFDIIFGEPQRYRIWFSANQARYVKQRKWSKSQIIEEQNDGSIILTMKVAGMEDVKRWVLSFGAQAKVIEPEELIRQIRQESEAIRIMYPM